MKNNVSQSGMHKESLIEFSELWPRNWWLCSVKDPRRSDALRVG